MDSKPNTSPFGATQPPATSSAPVPTPPFNTNPPPMQPAQAPVIQIVQHDSSPTLITILLLLFLTPIGIIVMWIWPKWKVWVKVVITLLPLVLLTAIGVMGIFASIVLVAINPTAQFRKANNTMRQNSTNTLQMSIEQLKSTNLGKLPPEVLSSLPVGVPVPLASASGPGIVALCEYLTGVRGTDVYLSRLPVDPKVAEPYQKWKDCNDFDTGFVLIESGVPGARIMVEAPLMEKVDETKSPRMNPETQQ